MQSTKGKAAAKVLECAVPARRSAERNGDIGRTLPGPRPALLPGRDARYRFRATMSTLAAKFSMRNV
jgi:hypothetical protein